MYIYYIAIGLHISKKYNQKRNKEIYVKYGGEFENGNLHYRNSYSQFVRYVNDISEINALVDTIIKKYI